MMNRVRPKHLALHKIKLPLPGFVSILHRISGLMLFLALPLILWILQASLRSIESYTQMVEIFQHPLSKLVILGVMWSFFHHFCAGIRYLALDIDIGTGLLQARASSRWVLVISLLFTIIAGVWLC
ncbi:MAG: succinate dehydrogenase, cytochrome b556 subunit [Gallionellaceae bacterium]|jgi:succinate dehydrogenase / fumarate reductase cytochrome b subunit